MKYVIISLKHGTAKKPVFWRINDTGYTYYPFVAGHYTEEQVKSNPNHYNDGVENIAVPLTDKALEEIGFKVSFNLKSLQEFHKKNKL